MFSDSEGSEIFVFWVFKSHFLSIFLFFLCGRGMGLGRHWAYAIMQSCNIITLSGSRQRNDSSIWPCKFIMFSSFSFSECIHNLCTIFTSSSPFRSLEHLPPHYSCVKVAEFIKDGGGWGCWTCELPWWMQSKHTRYTMPALLWCR